MIKLTARYYRSIIIGVLGLGSLIYVAAEQYDVPWENLGWMLVYTLAAMFSVMVIAAVVVALWIGLRKLLRRGAD